MGDRSASDARYRSLFDHHPDGVYGFDLDGRLVAGNRSLAETTGYAIDELLGRTFLPLVHPEDLDRVQSEFRRTVEGQTRDYTMTGIHKDGGIFHLHVTQIPIVVEGEVVGVYGIARDIGDSIANRRALERSEAQIRQMFQSAGVGMAVMTREGSFLRVNQAFASMTGYDDDELDDESLSQITHPEDRPLLDEARGLLLQGNRPSVAVETRCVHASGHTVWLRLSLTLLNGSDTSRPRLLATIEDLTALREVDERLEESRSLARMAGAMARMGGWHADLATGRMRWSPEIHELLNHPGDEPPSLAVSVSRYVDEDRPHVAAALQACAEDGTPFDLEAQVEPRRGHRLWVRIMGEPERDAVGRVVGIRGVMQDIDQHKHAEQQTRELAQRLTSTLESITDAVLSLDDQWRYTYLNRRAGEMLQRDPQDLMGRVIWDVFPELQGTIVEQVCRRVAANGVSELIEEFFVPPLQTWFDMTVYPSEGGVTIYFRDVSEQHEAHVRLQEGEARLREQARLLDRARDAIVVRDFEGRITYWNESAERLYGWRASEALGRVARDLIYADTSLVDEAWDRTWEAGEWAGELVQVDRDGQEIVVEARWTLVQDEDMEGSVMTINTDVTERKAIEQQFLRAQRMESLGTLASGIAHDLNNALSPVLMASQFLAADETDPTRLELLEIISTTTRRSADMVQQVLSFARGIDGIRAPVDLASVLLDVERLVTETFPKNITVVTDTPPEAWLVVGDHTQLHQVLLNLCVNARDAMPDGGTLTLALANIVVDPPDVADSAEQPPGPYVRVTVADTGTGMPAEVLDRAFEPFFTTKPQATGTGLGLSTSLGIVESHGGALRGDSQPGAGSTFTIHLPATPSAELDVPETEERPSHGSGEMVLLVDDEPAVRHVTQQVLEHAGYVVVPAEDGVEATELAQQHRDDLALVLTDMMMPRMDGVTAVERIRQLRADVAVVAIGGLHAELERAAVRLGTTYVVRKPFTPHALLHAVAAALAEREAE